MSGRNKQLAMRPPTVNDWTEIDLPRPPSVNRFMGKLGNRSPAFQSWMSEADFQFWEARKNRGALARIPGHFEVEFIFNPSIQRKADLDNCIKPLLDWMQRVELIENDKFCDQILARWGGVPYGVRIRVRGVRP